MNAHVEVKSVDKKTDFRLMPPPEFYYFERSRIENSISCVFEEVVHKHENNLAIVTRNYQWTYADLYRHILRISGSILANEITAGSRVALLLEHDAPMVAGVFGALKAGMAYVPLDPEYPFDRLEFILKDSEASALVVSDDTLDLANTLKGDSLRIINIDELQDLDWEVYPDISPNDFAYILYTSGSTGTPKGVVQTHRNVLHFIRNYTNNLEISANDRMTLLSSYSFDAAIMAIFGAMLNGACLFPKSVAADGFASVVPWLLDNKITIYHSTPTVYRYVLAAGDEYIHFPHVRRVVLGGEAVVRRDVELYCKFFPDNCTLINGLGPTESTVTLQNHIDKTTEIPSNTVPVGYPVEDTEVYLIDEDGAVSDKEGEIIFKSEHLALGYLNLKEITDKSFFVDPKNPSKRCYRTGDLGRFLPDGKLEFLGRKDFQVKIHGVRIELGEIESVLNGHGRVKESVVVAKQAKNGKSELIAYLILSDGIEFDAHEIRNYIQKKLPTSMCPNHFVAIEKYPFTPTGKIDRKNLERRDIQKTIRNPEKTDENISQIQQIVIDSWKSQLGIDVDIDDDFFDIGGDSLSAVQLCDLLEQRLGKKVNLATLFECRTARSLAEKLETVSEGEEASALIVPLTQSEQGSGAHLFCICGIYLYEPLAQLIGEKHSVSGIFLPVEEIALRENRELPSLEKMASMYGGAVRKIQPKGPYCLAGLSFGGLLAYELARQLTEAGEQVNLLAMFDAMLPNSVSKYDRIKAHMKIGLKSGPRYFLDKTVETIKNKCAGNSGEPEFVDDKLEGSKRNMAIMRNKMYDRAAFVYRSKMPEYKGSATFFKAGERTEFRKLTDGPHCGWEEFIQGELETHEAPGNHITMLDRSNVKGIAEVLKKKLDRAVENVP